MKTVLFDVPTDGKQIKGTCGAAESQLEVEAANLTFKLRFFLNATSKQYRMELWINKTVAAGEFDGAGGEMTNYI